MTLKCLVVSACAMTDRPTVAVSASAVVSASSLRKCFELNIQSISFRGV